MRFGSVAVAVLASLVLLSSGCKGAQKEAKAPEANPWADYKGTYAPGSTDAEASPPPQAKSAAVAEADAKPETKPKGKPKGGDKRKPKGAAAAEPAAAAADPKPTTSAAADAKPAGDGASDVKSMYGADNSATTDDPAATTKKSAKKRSGKKPGPKKAPKATPPTP